MNDMRKSKKNIVFVGIVVMLFLTYMFLEARNTFYPDYTFGRSKLIKISGEIERGVINYNKQKYDLDKNEANAVADFFTDLKVRREGDVRAFASGGITIKFFDASGTEIAKYYITESSTIYSYEAYKERGIIIVYKAESDLEAYIESVVSGMNS